MLPQSRRHAGLAWCLAVALVSTLVLAAGAESLRLVGQISLPNVHGRIDHLAFDAAGNRLFVAALGNDTVEVIDLLRGERVTQIGDQREPQGLAYVPAKHLLVVANGQDTALRFYDAQTLKLLRSVPIGSDGDNVRLDSGRNQVYVGYGDGAIAGISLDGQKTMDVAVGGHPESFQLETQGSRIFVNVPSKRAVVVIDRTTKAVTATWPLNDVAANYPMALDEEHHRLFVAARRPARLVVLDTASGKRVAQAEIAGDCDDLFYDRDARRLYAIGGEGAVTVLDAGDSGSYQPLGTVPTAAGARTGLFGPSLKRLYVAVPARGATPAEIRIFTP
jgi:DNA-binding beta-propeller fold protein YncE